MNAKNRAWWVGAYVAMVLLVDTLAYNRIHWSIDLGFVDFSINWTRFQWTGDGALSHFDYFKFLFWFVIPFALCFWEMDWGYFGFARWTRTDLYILAVLVALGLLCVGAIAFIPQLREYYPSTRTYPWEVRSRIIYGELLWNLSWLPGWEFMHRYFLLRPFAERWPRAGWLVVPLAEGLYHLQKSPLEIVAMVIGSILFTQWTLLRKNLMLPFFVHAAVEIGLILFKSFV